MNIVLNHHFTDRRLLRTPKTMVNLSLHFEKDSVLVEVGVGSYSRGLLWSWGRRGICHWVEASAQVRSGVIQHHLNCVHLEYDCTAGVWHLREKTELPVAL